MHLSCIWSFIRHIIGPVLQPPKSATSSPHTLCHFASDFQKNYLSDVQTKEGPRPGEPQTRPLYATQKQHTFNIHHVYYGHASKVFEQLSQLSAISAKS